MSRQRSLQTAAGMLSLKKPLVMGVLNITPDSFSDGGGLYEPGRVLLDKVLQRAQAMVDAGVGLLDVGGESTRPGAAIVTSEEEMDRVLPVLEALIERFDVPVSIDTSNPALMHAAVRGGAAMINDVRAFTRENALETVAASGVAICVMHMQGEPESMQNKPAYHDVVEDVQGFLNDRVAACLAAGVSANSLLIDPGFGFGKSLPQNLRLFNGLPEICSGEYPVVVGISRKSMIGSILNKEVDDRLAGGLAFASLAVWHGASIIRAHDVAETQDVIDIVNALTLVGS